MLSLLLLSLPHVAGVVGAGKVLLSEQEAEDMAVVVVVAGKAKSQQEHVDAAKAVEELQEQLQWPVQRRQEIPILLRR